MNVENACKTCSDPAELMCQRCREYYCTLECQISDWPQHKYICIPIPNLVNIDQRRNGTPLSSGTNNRFAIKTVPQTSPYHDLKLKFDSVKQENFKLKDPKPLNKMFKAEINEHVPSIVKDGSINKVNEQNEQLIADLSPQTVTTSREIESKNYQIPNDTLPKIDSISIQQVDVARNIPPPTPKIPNQLSSTLSGRLAASFSQKWQEIFTVKNPDNSEVIVQYVDSSKPTNCWVMEYHLSSDCDKYLQDINISLMRTPNNPIEIIIGGLVAAPMEGVFYRAKILQVKLEKVIVRLIDYGDQIWVPTSQLKPANELMRARPAYAFEIKFDQPHNKVIGKKFSIKIRSFDKESNIYLVDRIPNGPTSVAVENNQNIPNNLPEQIVSLRLPANVPIKENFVCRTDIKVIELIETTNHESKVYVLDDSELVNNFINCCIVDATLLREFFESQTKINDFCKVQRKEKYSPQIGELCFAIFSKDGNWYRVVCMGNPKEEKCPVEFIDFGNSDDVSTINILPMSKDFLYPTLSNRCCLNGMPPNISPTALQKIHRQLADNPVLTTSTVTKLSGQYMLDIPSIIAIANE